MVQLDQPTVVPVVDERHASPAQERPGPPRVKPINRQTGGLHRYCSGCAHETEHVAWSHDGQASIPSIRWPATGPAGGTTICLNCGQWRAATSQPTPPAWSSWPRKLIAIRSLATVDPSAPPPMGFPKPRRRTRECRPSASRRLREEAPACAASLQQLAHDNHASRGFLSVGRAGRGAAPVPLIAVSAAPTVVGDRYRLLVAAVVRMHRSRRSQWTLAVRPGGCDRPGVASGGS